MLPLNSGFSVGQSFVIQAAGWGIGMARSVYTNAVTAIGPDAMVVATPIIPGAGTTILNLMENELCAAYVNAAAGSTIIPSPSGTIIGSSSGQVLTYPYTLSAGLSTNNPACGSVTIPYPLASTGTYSDVANQMVTQQKDILNSTLTTLRPQIQTIAQNYWNTKQQSALSGLQALYTSTVSSYTSQMTTAAQTLTQNLRSAQTAADARSGNLELVANQTQLSALGWTSAGACYLEFARLNGLTLSLAGATPIINTPSFDGLSSSMTSDIAPLYTSSTSLLGKLKIYVDTQDGLETPSGYGASTGQYTGGDPNSLIETVFRSLHITPYLLNTFVNSISPTTTEWSDPFGGLMQLGQKMTVTAIAILSSARRFDDNRGPSHGVATGVALVGSLAVSRPQGCRLDRSFSGAANLLSPLASFSRKAR